MSKNTAIEWTHHTFNTHWGCAAVSPGCKNCYAEALAARFGTLWGVDAERRAFGDKHWAEPLAWDRQAAKAGAPAFVFSNSMSDLFDKNAPPGVRERWFELTKATPHLIWLALTKRIGNVEKMLPTDWGTGYKNVWLGSSIVNEEEGHRDIPKLLAVPAVKHFLSMEPLLGPVDLTTIEAKVGLGLDVLGCLQHDDDPDDDVEFGTGTVDWVIVGGESGPGARPMHPDWVRSLRNQCVAAGVPYLFKQWGEWIELDTGAPEPLVAREGDPEFEAQLALHDGFISLDGHFCTEPDAMQDGVPYRGLRRIGKKAAGRLLDGVEWNSRPQ